MDEVMKRVLMSLLGKGFCLLGLGGPHQEIRFVDVLQFVLVLVRFRFQGLGFRAVPYYTSFSFSFKVMESEGKGAQGFRLRAPLSPLTPNIAFLWVHRLGDLTTAHLNATSTTSSQKPVHTYVRGLRVRLGSGLRGLGFRV